MKCTMVHFPHIITVYNIHKLDVLTYNVCQLDMQCYRHSDPFVGQTVYFDKLKPGLKDPN